MKKILCLLLLCLLILPALGCAGKEKTATDSFYLMDTVITVTLYTDEGTADPIFRTCRALLAELDTLWARQKEGSDPANFNASETGTTADPRTLDLIRTAISVSSATEGAFDITVAPLTDLWATCEERDSLPTAEELSQTREKVGYGRIGIEDETLKKSSPAVQIDLGGIGKGAAIGILIDYLRSTDARGGIVSFGSNIAVFGKKPDGKEYRIAVRDPNAESGVAGALNLCDGEILSVSGDYERFFTIQGEKYHHILSPATGYPAATGLCSVAVVCSDGALADALSTALFVLGMERSLDLYRAGVFDFEAVFLSSDGEVSTTDGLRGRWEKQ